MCGITGFIQWNRDLTQESELLVRMTDSLSNRGPNAQVHGSPILVPLDIGVLV